MKSKWLVPVSKSLVEESDTKRLNPLFRIGSVTLEDIVRVILVVVVPKEMSK